jgi:hypothetical protein
VVEFSLTPDEIIIPHLGCCSRRSGTVKKLALSVGNGSYRSLLHKKRGEIAPLLSNFNLKVGVKVWIDFHWKISTRITYNSTLTNHIVHQFYTGNYHFSFSHPLKYKEVKSKTLFVVIKFYSKK